MNPNRQANLRICSSTIVTKAFKNEDKKYHQSYTWWNISSKNLTYERSYVIAIIKIAVRTHIRRQLLVRTN